MNDDPARTDVAPGADILVVDDTPANLHLLVGMLGHAGYRTRVARSGELALTAARSQPPDLILLDIMMPAMDGYEVCRQLKADEALREIPVIFMSALGEPMDKVHAFGVGGVDYVTKPFQIQEVRARVEAHLNLVRLKREVQEHDRVSRALLDASPDAAYVVESDGTVVTANEPGSVELGIPPEKLIGARLWDALPHEVCEQRRAAAAEVTASGVPVRFEDDACGRRFDNTIYPLPASRGISGRLAVHSMDVTAQRLAEEQVLRNLMRERELREIQSTFVSMTSHEFRTPLTTILASAEMLEHYGREWEESKTLEYLHRIEEAVQGVTRLLDNVLLIGKSHSGALAFSPKPLDLADLTRDLVEEYRLADASGHVIALALSGDTAVCADPVLLRHVLGNLLSNALKYSPAGSEVRVGLDCTGDDAIFTVADSGVGIPSEHIPRLFEPFNRAANVANIDGTGLGLAIAKASVDIHRGVVSVLSQEGVGTTFTVVVPVRDEGCISEPVGNET